MNDPQIAIRKIGELLHGIRQGTVPDVNGAYAAARVLVIALRRKAESEGVGKRGSFISEKLTQLESHMDAAFGADVDNGHSVAQHVSSCMGPLKGLAGEYGFGRVEKG